MTRFRARWLAKQHAGPYRDVDDRQLKRIPTHWLFWFTVRPGVGPIMGGTQAVVYDRKTGDEETFGFEAEGIVTGMAAGLAYRRYDLVVTEVRDAPRAADLLAALEMRYASTPTAKEISRMLFHDAASVSTALGRLPCVFAKQDLRPSYQALVNLRGSDALVHHIVPLPGAPYYC